MEKLILFLLTILVLVCFSQAAIADIYDDFNDGVIDANKWDVWEYWMDDEGNVKTAAPVYETNGSLNIDYISSPAAGGVSSTAFFGGDFDFRTAWKNWQYDGTSGAYENYMTQIGINVRRDDGSEWGESAHIFRGWTSEMPEGYRDLYVSYAYVVGAWPGIGVVTTPEDTAGYLGIERIGSTINTYYSDINHPNYDDWKLLKQVDNAFTEPVSVELRAYTGDNTNSFHAEWDNVEVEADSIIPPRSNPPEDLPQPEPSLPRDQLVNLISDEPLNPNKPTILIAHGGNTNYSGWVSDMGNAIAERTSGVFNVGAWDWKEEAEVDSNTDWLKILPRAYDQGTLLGNRLRNDNLTKGIHLIGHSAGGRLIEEAGRFLERSNIDIDQLTFLDSPLQPDKLYGSSAGWADNYISSYLPSPTAGADAQDSYNYSLSGNDHSYAHDYYIETIKKLSVKKGFYWSLAGGGWDDPDKPRINTSARQDPNSPASLPTVVSSVERDDFLSLGNWLSSGDVSFINEVAILREASSAFLFKDMTIPFEADFFSFDFMFTDNGDGDYLTAHFNEELLYWFEGQYFPGGDLYNSNWLDIGRFAGQTGTFTFSLNSIGDINSEVWIDNLEFYNVSPVPEPSSLILLGTGLLGIIGYLRKRVRC